MQLKGACVLITGASGGIGAALARRLGAAGAELLLTGRQHGSLIKLQAELTASGVKAHICCADLAEAEGRRLLVAWVQGRQWPLRVLINNAGINDFVSYQAQPPARIEQLMHLNLLAPMLLTQALLPILQGQPQALVVNVGSTLGAIGYPGYVTYCASKFGLRGFTEALARELADTPVRVAYVSPRPTATALNDSLVDELNAALGNATDAPDWVAARICDLIERDRPTLQLGWPEKLFVRINALLPALVSRAIYKQLPLIRRYLAQRQPKPVLPQ